MSRFDVYPGRGMADYYVDVQADFHAHLRTRVVIPLQSSNKVVHPTRGLHTPITVHEEHCYLVTPMMAAVSVQQLGKPVCNVREQSDTITSAIDFLLQGF